MFISTVIIVLFGEIIPQAFCHKYGLGKEDEMNFV
jgi:CBS domain containing-hemolysin-like protein